MCISLPNRGRLARKCVKTGRVNVLQEAEERRRRFMKTLEEVDEVEDRDGSAARNESASQHHAYAIGARFGYKEAGRNGALIS
jgi:hypothetical protein